MPRYAIIKLYLPGQSDEEHQKLLEKWHTETPDKRAGETATSAYTAPYMGDLLASLDRENDSKDFEDLKLHVDDLSRRQFILSRVGREKSLAENFTPKCIKALRPPRPGVVLVWQIESGAFQGYFPIPDRQAGKESNQKSKTHFSRSRSYNVKRTKLQALKEIVNWLWKLHENYKGET